LHPKKDASICLENCEEMKARQFCRKIESDTLSGDTVPHLHDAAGRVFGGIDYHAATTPFIAFPFD
jgi:hypothetical protein